MLIHLVFLSSIFSLFKFYIMAYRRSRGMRRRAPRFSRFNSRRRRGRRRRMSSSYRVSRGGIRL